MGNPDVADVTILDPSHLYVLGKRLGNTNVILLCGSGPCDTIEVEVTYDLDGLKTKLHQLFPNEHPEVRSSQGSIVLSGQVSSLQKMDAIVKIAHTFLLRANSPFRIQGQLVSVYDQPGENAGGSSMSRQPGSSPEAPLRARPPG